MLLDGNKYENKWVFENQRDVPQQHIRIETDGVEEINDKNVIFSDNNEC
jgi:hypothetical protein